MEKIKHPILSAPVEIDKINTKYPHTVQKFSYNGFCVQTREGNTNYRAAFKEWTNDPGIFKASCSDGKDRLIPTCVIDNSDLLPEQVYNNVPDIFGQPSES